MIIQCLNQNKQIYNHNDNDIYTKYVYITAANNIGIKIITKEVIEVEVIDMDNW